MGERVDGIAPRDHAPREHEQHRKALDPPREVGRQLERRRVGEVDVVEQQHERPVGRRVLGELDRRFEQPRAGEVGRHLGGLDPRAPEPQRQRRREPRELLGPAGVGGWRLELARQPRQQLDPGRERRRAAEVRGGAASRARMVRAGAGDQLEREPGLADPGLTADHRDAAAAGAHRLPQRGQLGQVLAATHQRPPVGRGRRPVRSLLGRRAVLADRGGERARLGGGCEAERAAQPIGEPVVDGERARAVAGLDHPPHQVTRGVLVERVEREPAPRPADSVVRGGGGRRELCQHRAEPLGVLVARLQHPVIVEVGEQRPAVQRDRGLEPPGGDVRVELGQVGLAAQRDTVAARDQRVVAGERPPQLPQRAAQRGARAGVEHVGPEARGDRAARVLAGMQREPRQQRPGAAAGRRGDGGAVDLGLQLAEELHSQHGRQAYTRLDACLTGG